MKKSKVDIHQLKKFGLLVGSIFFILALWAFKKELLTIFYCEIALAFFLIGSVFLKIEILIPVYRLWMKIGHILGVINTTILLSLIFFLIIYPISLIKKLVSKDNPFVFKTNKPTYWLKKDIQNYKENLKRQF